MRTKKVLQPSSGSGLSVFMAGSRTGMGARQLAEGVRIDNDDVGGVVSDTDIWNLVNDIRSLAPKK